METSPRRSSVTRTTKELKDVEVPPNHFKNSVASVSPSTEGDCRSVYSSIEADRPFFFYFDADDDGRQGTKATMTRSERTRLTSDFDGLVTAGRTVVVKGKCDVIVTDCMM